MMSNSDVFYYNTIMNNDIVLNRSELMLYIWTVNSRPYYIGSV